MTEFLTGFLVGLLAGRFGAVLDRLTPAFRPFLAFAALALFGFFMGILLNEGLRGFTKTG
ncbi:hypothetical protein [Bradyrhizobium sp. 1]|uniref:hypothetical protein n=1 Tax=Bradyrhizobium sp. 1 TaxID=241591 RepID=UPI001FF7491B